MCNCTSGNLEVPGSAPRVPRNDKEGGIANRNYSAAAWNGPRSPSGTAASASARLAKFRDHLREPRPSLAPPFIHVDRAVKFELDCMQSRPSACIVWIFFDPNTLSLGPFLWFGGAPGERMPALGETVARHTKPNGRLKKADRPAHRVIAKNRFASLDTIDDVIARLIGV
jgi:hypothetical protein